MGRGSPLRRPPSGSAARQIGPIFTVKSVAVKSKRGGRPGGGCARKAYAQSFGALRREGMTREAAEVAPSPAQAGVLCRTPVKQPHGCRKCPKLIVVFKPPFLG